MAFNFAKAKWEKRASRGQATAWTKRGQIVEGIYQGATPNKYQGKVTHLLRFKGPKGEDIGVWETTVLAFIREDVKKGTAVRIQYLGDVKKGKRTYKNFDIFTA